MQCHNGQCQGTVCQNGVCHQVSFQAASKNQVKAQKGIQRNADEFIVEVPDGGDVQQVEGPRGVSKEEFMRILQKIKEHMESQGLKDA